MKTAFVLSGGGAKGAYQVGVIRALIEKGIVPDMVYGTSVGALNAVGLKFAGLEGLEDIWANIKKRKDVVKLNLWELLTMRSKALYNLKPMRKKVKKVLAEHPYFDDMSVKVCVTNLKDGSVQYYPIEKTFWELEKSVDYVLASASIPVVMDPINKYLVDGGVREQTPLKQAIKDGATKIVVIMCNPLKDSMNTFTYNEKSFFPMFRIGLRSLGAMGHEIMLNDIKKCQEINSLSPRKMVGRKRIDLEIFTPDKLVIDTLDFDQSRIQKAIKQGYDAAK